MYNIDWSKKNVLAVGRWDGSIVAWDLSGLVSEVELSAAVGATSNAFSLELVAPANRNVRIQQTIDFRDWFDWTNVPTAGGAQSFEYFLETNRIGFFRAVLE